MLPQRGKSVRIVEPNHLWGLYTCTIPRHTRRILPFPISQWELSQSQDYDQWRQGFGHMEVGSSSSAGLQTHHPIQKKADSESLGKELSHLLIGKAWLAGFSGPQILVAKGTSRQKNLLIKKFNTVKVIIDRWNISWRWGRNIHNRKRVVLERIEKLQIKTNNNIQVKNGQKVWIDKLQIGNKHETMVDLSTGLQQIGSKYRC